MPTPSFTHSIWEDGYQDQLIPAFHLAFGEFIRQFGQIESSLAYNLETFVISLIGNDNLRLDITRNLLGSRSIAELPVTIKLCVEAADRSGKSYEGVSVRLSNLFNQLSEIRNLRNRTAHYAIHPEKSIGTKVYFRSVNVYTVTDPYKTQEILFQIEDLEAATADMKMVYGLVGQNLRGILDPSVRSYVSDTPPDWNYKPSNVIKTVCGPFRPPDSV